MMQCCIAATRHTGGMVKATPVAPAEGRPARPARVTLNMPPDLYRQVQRWADDAAEALDRPRVGVQDALRAMIRACISDQAARGEALARLHSGPDGGTR